MTRKAAPIDDDYDDPLGPASLYDPQEPQDLWFLPDSDADPLAAPLPQADHRPLIAPDDWRAAEAHCAVALAHAAADLGRLDATVAAFGAGAIDRLALREAEAMSWAAGTPVPVEEIARARMQARAATDLHGLAQARWAVRRLAGAGALDDLRGFLGLHRVESDGLPQPAKPRPTGAEFDTAAEAFLANMGAFAQAHPLTRGAYARTLWRLSDLSPVEDQVEGATWAARTMAQGCEALSFVPMGPGRRVLSGAPDLARHLGAVGRAARAGRAELLRINAWAARARSETATIKGDSPARIITALVARPMATTQDVEEAAGISRDSAERMLARMAKMGLLREVTGARRFRLWAAAP